MLRGREKRRGVYMALNVEIMSKFKNRCMICWINGMGANHSISPSIHER
jgi:hypothetical protein